MNEKLTQVLDRIKEVRITHNIRQKELAAHLEMDVRTYNNIENGKSNLSLQQLFAIADFFKKEVDYFISSNKHNQLENCSHSGVFYDSSVQNNHSQEAIHAYKMLTERLMEEINALKKK
jgi:transcriptional regulator with XRE-family HTH domain